MSRTLMLSECSLRELSSLRLSWVACEGSCVRMRMRGATGARGTESVWAALTGAASLDRLVLVCSIVSPKQSVGQPSVGLTWAKTREAWAKFHLPVFYTGRVGKADGSHITTLLLLTKF